MKILVVKCPYCQAKNDLGEKAVELYNSSLMFLLNRTCTSCGEFFVETDTSEADYNIEECPIPGEEN